MYAPIHLGVAQCLQPGADQPLLAFGQIGESSSVRSGLPSWLRARSSKHSARVADLSKASAPKRAQPLGHSLRGERLCYNSAQAESPSMRRPYDHIDSAFPIPRQHAPSTRRSCHRSASSGRPRFPANCNTKPRARTVDRRHFFGVTELAGRLPHESRVAFEWRTRACYCAAFVRPLQGVTHSRTIHSPTSQ